MAIRIWLSKSAIEKIESSGPGAAESFMSIRVSRESGQPYLDIGAHILSPTAMLPRLPKGSVRCVTVLTSLHEGFRSEGEYVRGKSRATCLTMTSAVGTENPIQRSRQDLEIRAPSLAAAQALYRAIRDGSLAPVSAWSNS